MSNNVHVNGFHHVAMKVKDYDASLKFYTELLGFALLREWGEADKRACMLDIGNGNCIELFAGGPDGVRADGHWIHLALSCGNTEAAMNKVRAAGYEVTVETKDVTIPSRPEPLPVRLGFFKGPDGEVIEFFQTL